ncbi:MAG: thioredoxin family protein [Akkermansiaceae bacterium]|nr:thioredoxin family protein [Akkermansiaceae bacterium]
MKKLLITAIVSAATALSAHAAEPGSDAPAFELKDLNGKTVSLDSLKGKVVVLEWVNFGCPFVKKHYSAGNMPSLQKEAAEKGAIWITINSSAEGKQGYMPADKMAKKAEEEGVAATHFCLDTDGKVGKAYGAKVTPHMFIIDAEGKVAYNGAIDSKATTKAADIEGADPLFKNALHAVIAGEEVEKAKNNPYGCGVKY